MTKVIGSAPQKPGSWAIFGLKGLLAGTIGGGKIENLISQKAIKAIKTKKSGYFEFELNENIAEQDSVICGGKMNIFIDALPKNYSTIISSITESYSNKIPGVLVTILTVQSSSNYTLERYWITSNDKAPSSHKLPGIVLDEINSMLERDIPGDYKEEIIVSPSEKGNNLIFLEYIKPLPELIIAGAGHIGKALCQIGKLLDFEVTIWDDRMEYANAENLPNADHILSGDFSNSLGKIKIDRDSFLVIVTRGHSQDSDVLKHFIRSKAGYIGMIGSRKKVAQIRELFLSNGWATTAEWEKVHAPIGLDINSKTVNEIAISIAAELIQERYNLYHSNG